MGRQKDGVTHGVHEKVGGKEGWGHDEGRPFVDGVAGSLRLKQRRRQKGLREAEEGKQKVRDYV